MIRTTAILAIAALTAAAIGISASSTASAQGFRRQQHQFQQAMLPTKTPGKYRLGLWIFNATTGKLRLCVLNDATGDAPVMKCTGWAGEGPAGRYYLMQIRASRRYGVQQGAGLWILNRQTGQARACVIRDVDDPTGSLRCSKVE